MTAFEFDTIVEERIKAIRSILKSKSEEYASNKDRLHNFKSGLGSIVTSETPLMVCWGYMRKHLQSIYDMISTSGKNPSVTMINEKIGDAINYLILLEALLKE